MSTDTQTPDGPTDEEFRAEQAKNLRAAIDSVLTLIMATEDAIQGIDDLAMDLDEIDGSNPVRFRHGDDPFDAGGEEDLNVPFFVYQVLSQKPLQMHRAALVVYLDGLNQYVERLHNMQACLGITNEEIGLGHTCGKQDEGPSADLPPVVQSLEAPRITWLRDGDGPGYICDHSTVPNLKALDVHFGGWVEVTDEQSEA